jgi:magnesium-transporting ATPase (P-type)
VHLTGVRNFQYRSRNDFTVGYQERDVLLSHLVALDFYVSYFTEGPVGHTFLSFIFDNAPPLSISIETRPEVGEGFAPVASLFKQFERIYVVGDERDIVVLAQPRHWDIKFIRNFMLVLGSVSSIFDFLTFGLLLWVFNATEALFQTGWFMESLATQVLVIFVIRTNGNPLRSRPNPVLAATSLAIVAVAIGLPYTAIGRWFGFVPLPLAFLAVLCAMVVCYPVLAEGTKRWFYRRYPPHGVTRSPILRSQFPLTGN